MQGLSIKPATLQAGRKPDGQSPRPSHRARRCCRGPRPWVCTRAATLRVPTL